MRRSNRDAETRGGTPGTRPRIWRAALVGLGLLAGPEPGRVVAAEPISGEDRDGGEFFEKQIRPVLEERCAKCHGAGDAAPKGGLDVRGPAGLLRGGDSGPAVVPGDPGGSLLIRAIRHDDAELRMPPKGRLAPDQVAAFEEWVKRGAPPPRETAPAGRPSASRPLERWAFQKPREPSLPRDEAGGAIDAFLVDRLERKGLRMAPPADKATLLRRATFDLTGVPPTIAEVDAFLADASPDAFAKVVDRLLASPRYGARWARHWLDLVRYCDDFDEAWRYRDWVVKSFNDDLPYYRFVMDQIAGDLIPDAEPGGVNADGIVATTVLSLGTWGGIDRRKRLGDIVDDQIDVVGRGFLGLTLACARCHDHKFDPISQEDYYGLAGIFYSTRVVPELGYLSHGTGRLRVPLVPASQVEAHERHAAKVREAEARLREEVDRRYEAAAAGLLPQTARHLVAAWEHEHRPPGMEGASTADIASRHGLQEFALKRWVDALVGARLGRYRLLDQPVRDFDGEPGVEVWRAAAERPWWSVNSTGADVGIETFLLPPHSVSINPGVEGGAVGWRSPITGTVRLEGRLVDGDPYDGSGVAWAVDLESGDGRRELASGRLPNGGSMRLDEGRAAGPLAAIPVREGDVLYFQAALGEGDAHYDITNVELTVSRADGEERWDLARDVGGDFIAGNPHADSLGHAGVWHFFDMAGSRRLSRMPAVDRMLERAWDPVAAGVASGKLDRAAIEAAAREVERAVVAEGPDGPLAHDLTGPRGPFRAESRDDARHLPAEARDALAKLSAEVEELKGRTPPLPAAHGVLEGGMRHGPSPGFGDARVHIRGSYERLGPRVPRRFPEALAGPDQPPIRQGSGRLELARWVASADNPLTARVMVNRIWQHHFGEGLVRTPSNFGRLGEPPTHPELLDYLARRFVESNWSVKAMHRRIMLSAAYRQSSEAPGATREADPENRLIGRMNRRRLDAEAIHDSLLALAGRLDERAGGPAESDASSPRRLIYVNVSRSSRSDFGSLFDRADAALHVERRTASTAAPQALLLMNDALVMDLARALADRPEVAAEDDAGRRVAILCRLVLGRPASEDEIALGRDFVAAAARELPPPGEGAAPPEKGAAGLPPWAQYAQALLLSNEFLFVD